MDSCKAISDVLYVGDLLSVVTVVLLPFCPLIAGNEETETVFWFALILVSTFQDLNISTFELDCSWKIVSCMHATL